MDDDNTTYKQTIEMRFNISSHACRLLTMKVNRLTFDSDSVPLGIDTCTTATLSGCRSDYVGEITPVQHTTLCGVGGTLLVVGKGTFIFNFIDDCGREQQLKVEDAYYVPQLKLCLFSPQQWACQGPTYHDGTYV